MSETRKSSLILPVAAAGLPLLLAAYVASIGPAYRWVVRNDDRGFGTFAKVYAPVLWAMGQSEAVRLPVAAYLEWWQDP